MHKVTTPTYNLQPFFSKIIDGKQFQIMSATYDTMICFWDFILSASSGCNVSVTLMVTTCYFLYVPLWGEWITHNGI